MANILLGVNIDHVAAMRNSRNTLYPDPIQAAFIAEQAGANGITVHLRQDRRHINERDIYILRKTIQTKMNLEIAVTDEMIKIACKTQPDSCCLVPEKRKEITTERGLDISIETLKITNAINTLQKKNIFVSLFIDANLSQVDAAIDTGVSIIEIHTGHYSSAKNIISREEELLKIKKVAHYAYNKGLKVNAGHGLNYNNIFPILSLPEIYEVNIGHAIISRSLFSGLFNAVTDMICLIKKH